MRATFGRSPEDGVRLSVADQNPPLQSLTRNEPTFGRRRHKQTVRQRYSTSSMLMDLPQVCFDGSHGSDQIRQQICPLTLITNSRTCIRDPLCCKDALMPRNGSNCLAISEFLCQNEIALANRFLSVQTGFRYLTQIWTELQGSRHHCGFRLTS